MDELERRIAAVELLLMEAVAEMTDAQRENISMRLAMHGAASPIDREAFMKIAEGWRALLKQAQDRAKRGV